MTKQDWLDISEVLNSFRAVPRVLLILYGYICYDSYKIAISPTATELQVEFAQLIWAGAAVWFSAYAGTGGKK